MKTIVVSDEHHQLLSYIIDYHKSKGHGFDRGNLTESFISNYAKKIATGILDETVRINMLTLIQAADTYTAQKIDSKIRKQTERQERAKNAGYTIE